MMAMLMILRLGKFREQLSDLRKHGNNNANMHTNTWVANMTLPARELGPALRPEVPKVVICRQGLACVLRVVSRRVMMRVLSCRDVVWSRVIFFRLTFGSSYCLLSCLLFSSRVMWCRSSRVKSCDLFACQVALALRLTYFR